MSSAFKGCMALAALACLALSSTAHADVVTFEDLSGSASLSPLNPYHGINFDSGWTYYDASQFPYTPHSGAERVYNYDANPSFTFVTPSVFQGAWFSGTDVSVSFTLLDASNNVLATSGSVLTSSTPAFLSSGYSGLVSTVEVTPYSIAPYWTMDDVTYNASASAQTPEPGSIALLIGMSVTGAGFLARRRRASK